MKNILHRIIEGFFIGLGIVLGGTIISALIYFSKIEEFIYPKPNINNLQIIEHRTFEHGNFRYVVGSFKKLNDETPKTISVKVDFFDENKKLVEQCESRIYQLVRKSQKFNFKVQCFYDKETTPIKFDSYSVYLTTF